MHRTYRPRLGSTSHGTWSQFGRKSKPMGSHFGVGAPPILVGILVRIGMFTGGRILLGAGGFAQLRSTCQPPPPQDSWPSVSNCRTQMVVFPSAENIRWPKETRPTRGVDLPPGPRGCEACRAPRPRGSEAPRLRGSSEVRGGRAHLGDLGSERLPREVWAKLI